MKTPLKPQDVFPLTADERQSFAGTPTPCRCTGPVRLVRLVQEGRRAEGKFWFEERVFKELRRQAMRDLLRQSAVEGKPFARALPDLVGMYMKHCLRSDLAICKNWTPNFDSYVLLSLSPADSVVGWVGAIANQPYYSHPAQTEPDYAAKKAIFDLAEAGGVSLLAQETQYVIDFDFSANQALRRLIQSPRPF